MPRGDRTGPMGMGSMTGRGMGGGWGRRNMYYATGQPGWMRFGPVNAPYQTPDPETEKQALKNQSDALQSQLNMIQKRLEEIETGLSGK
jgi:hypothetical protein